MNEQTAVNSEASNSQQTQEDIFADMPTVDSQELVLDGEESVDQTVDEAGEEADEPTTQASEEIEVDGEKITKDEIKELVQLKQAYTQQRQADSEKVRTIEAKAYEVVSEVQQVTAHQIQMIKQSVRQLIAPGITPEYLMQLAAVDPAAAQQHQARLSALDMWERQIDQASGNLYQQAMQTKEQGSQTMTQQRFEFLKSEAQKLMTKSWYTSEFQSQVVSYLAKNGIPESAAQSIGYAGAFEIVRKAMLYDKAISGQKNKQTQSSAVIPGSRAANGKIADKQSFQKLEQRALQGDKAARAAYVSALIPTLPS
jgi:hypothetical protein